jgi:L-asparaginase II
LIREQESLAALSVELLRGETVESIHHVSLALVNVQGRRLMTFGDVERPIFLRSSAKPFQALPFVERGVFEHLKLDLRQLAIMCASHSGTDEHVDVVQDLLSSHQLSQDSLRCGVHTPFDKATAKRLISEGKESQTLRNNCSGKHTGMLLHAQAMGISLHDYLEREHPVQQAIIEVIGEMSGVDTTDIRVGTDGCSAPNFAVPLVAAALAYARLMDPSELEEKRALACRTIVEAMRENPVMVAGHGRFDTSLMQVGGPRLISKGGAEGYQAVGLSSGVLPDGYAAGLTLKVHDGDLGKRARGLVTLTVLQSLGVINDSEIENMKAFDERRLYNFMGLDVGCIRLQSASRKRLMQAYEQI